MAQTFETPKDAITFLRGLTEPELGRDKCFEEYSKKTGPETYENSIGLVDYLGPRYCAEMLSGVISDRANAHVLDIAAGTGRVGQELRKRGFSKIDALDGAESMVDYCKKTGFYENFIVSFVGDAHPLPITDNTYDTLTCSGATFANHLPASAQSEFIRVIKPGGFFVNCYRADLTDNEYGTRWFVEAQRLVDDRKWELYGRLTFPQFHTFSEGIVDIYRVL